LPYPYDKFAESLIAKNKPAMPEQVTSLKKDSSDPGKYFRSDESFDTLYGASIRRFSKRHWTPLQIAKTAADFLVGAANGAKILDIGSGTGKFCLVAGYYFPKTYWYGIEQRKHLAAQAKKINNMLQLRNVFFKTGNFTEVNFKEVDHFYFFNSFYENLDNNERIDESIDYSEELYSYYSRYLCKQLELKPPGTRLATLHGMDQEVPLSYAKVGEACENQLKFWIKSK
jgi:SAM-dependent methyltransferase